MSLPQVLTAPKVADLLGCSSRTVHRLVHDGKLAYFDKLAGPNGAFLFYGSEVERYMATLPQASTTEVAA